MSEMVISSLVGVEQAFLVPPDFFGVFLSLPLAEVTAVLPGLAAAGLFAVAAADPGVNWEEGPVVPGDQPDILNYFTF